MADSLGESILQRVEKDGKISTDVLAKLLERDHQQIVGTVKSLQALGNVIWMIIDLNNIICVLDSIVLRHLIWLIASFFCHFNSMSVCSERFPFAFTISCYSEIPIFYSRLAIQCAHNFFSLCWYAILVDKIVHWSDHPLMMIVNVLKILGKCYAWWMRHNYKEKNYTQREALSRPP